MQSTLDSCESNVSSTSSSVKTFDEGTTSSSTQLLAGGGTDTHCTAGALSVSPSESPIQLPVVCVHDDVTSTDVVECETQSTDIHKEGETCVNPQQMDSSSSDENEDEGHPDKPNYCDNASDGSEFSDFSQESWQPVQGPIAWVQEKMRRGQSPRKILQDLVPSGTVIPEGLDPIMLWKIIINIVSEPPKRKKLNDINTLDDVQRVLSASKKIIVLTGAGVSVSCGIPDFRSRDGVYARLAKDFPNLPDPQAMFDIHFFRHDPRPFFKFAREIFPGQFKPSPCHRFIRMLEEKGKLLRNYTQNIDTLEQVAGIQRVVQCHGSFATATCTVCGHKVDSSAIRDEIFSQGIPRCTRCSPQHPNAVMKPDIVFFGEGLPEHFHNQMAADKDECDLLIVIGSSLKVRPVALIPNSLPASVPQILINRERLHYLNFDVELLGNCDDIIGELCRRLGPGWEELAASGPPLSEILMSSLPTPPASPHSRDSVDRWDDGSNPTVTSSEGMVNCSGNKLEEFPAAATEQADEAFPSDQTCRAEASEKSFSTQKDGDARDVSTSQSEPGLTAAHKYHHRLHSPHNRSLKRPFAETDHPVVPAGSSLPEVDPASDVFCSAKEMESLVSACHRKDVVFAPPEKSSSGHHGHHSQQSHVSPSHQSSVFEQPLSPECQNNSHSGDCQTHKPDLASTESSEVVSSHREMNIFREKFSSQLQSTEMVPSGSKTLVERNLDSTTCDEAGPESKKPRLSGKESEESGDELPGLTVSEAKVCGSEPIGQSLSDVHKLWNSRHKVSLAQLLTDNQVLFVPPSRYIFKGAEVFSGSETDDDDDDSSSSSSSSSDDENCGDNGSSSDVDKGSGEDKSSVDKDADQISQGVLVSSEKAGAGLESCTFETAESSHQQTLTASPSGAEVDLKSAGSSGQSLFNLETRAALFSDSEVCVQRSECETSSDIPRCPDKIGEGSTQCHVSSSGDVDFEEMAPKSD